MPTQDQKYVTGADGLNRPEVIVAPPAVPASSTTINQTALSTSAKQILAANANRRFSEVKNMDASIIVYVGKDNSVTSGNGYPIKAGEAFDFEGYAGAIFAVAASGTPTLAYIEW